MFDDLTQPLEPGPSLPRGSELHVGAMALGNEMTLTLRGSSQLLDSRPLTAVLLHYHKEALRVGARSVALDLREVRLLEQGAFDALLRWFQAMRPGQGYTVRIRTDARSRWLRASLHALSTFAVGLVTVEA